MKFPVGIFDQAHPSLPCSPCSLTFAQRRWGNVVLVPEPVSLLQDLELLAQEATERRSDNRPGERTLGEPPGKEVDVLDVLQELGNNLNPTLVQQR